MKTKQYFILTVIEKLNNDYYKEIIPIKEYDKQIAINNITNLLSTITTETELYAYPFTPGTSIDNVSVVSLEEFLSCAN